MPEKLYYRSTVIGELPDGWGKATIDTQLVDIMSGFACAKKNIVPAGVPHLRPFNVTTAGEVVITPDTVEIPRDFREDLERFHLQAGDVLFNNTNSVELVGKTGIVRQPMSVAFSNHINRLRVRHPEQADPRWLALALRHLQEKGFFEAHCRKWIGQAGFNQTELANVEIPLPNITEQRRIVGRIEALLGEVREMRRLQEEIAGDVGRLMDAVLSEVFPPLDRPMPSGWSVRTVAGIASKPQYGYTKSASNAPIGPKFLRITDIQDGTVNWDDVPYCECDEDCLRKYQLRTDDIVFARSGATTGKTYLVKDPPDNAVFASYLIRLQLTEGLPNFVYWYFQSPGYWRQVTPVGAAIPNMNAKVLQQVRIPFPEVREQAMLVSRIEAVAHELSEMRASVLTDGELMKELEEAVLGQAFRGEL